MQLAAPRKVLCLWPKAASSHLPVYTDSQAPPHNSSKITWQQLSSKEAPASQLLNNQTDKRNRLNISLQMSLLGWTADTENLLWIQGTVENLGLCLEVW